MAGKKSPKGKGAPAPAKAKTPKAPKAKGDVSVAAPAQVASDAQKREAMDRLVEAAKKRDLKKKDFDAAASSYRALVREACKITGYSKEAVSWYMESRNRDVAEIDAETRERNRIAQFMNLPIGSQLGMFADGKSVASQTPTERDATKDKDPQVLAACEAQGMQASLDGASFNSCEFPLNSKRRERWQKGWELGQKQRAEEIGKAGKAPTHEAAHA